MFQPNPFAAGGNTNARLVDDVSTSSYHSLQMELRRTFRRGLSITANYTLSHSMSDLGIVSSTGEEDYTTLRDARQGRGIAPFDLRHVFQTYGSYDLPFSSSNGALNRILGGWTISGVLRYQSGRVFRLSSDRQVFNTEENGVVTSLTADELQKMVRISPGPNNNIYYFDRSLIGSDGRADVSKMAPVTTPGVMGQFIDLTGPRFFLPDLALLKEIPVTERVHMNLWVQFVNAFNHPNFLIGGGDAPGSNQSITSATFGQTSNTSGGPRNIQFRLNISF
jgi:hypothetical protein